MPYIKPEDRLKFGHELNELAKVMIDGVSLTPGDLNYLVTNLCNFYMKRKGVSYTHYNDVIGVLECAKLEFYRRKIIPYEILKIKENGNV